LRSSPLSREPRQLTLHIHPCAPPEFVFARVFRRLGIRRSVPDFHIEFRPFSSLRSSINLRGNRARVRISDVLKEAPPIVLEALAEILLAQLFRRQASEEARECYLAYVFEPAVRRRIDETRCKRGRLRLLPAQGKHFDLGEIFARLNERFFKQELTCSRIGWSARHSRSVLGHYDPAHKTITISRSLDSPAVPDDVVEYLVFHEMLHIRFPLERHGSRRVMHSRAFRVAEKSYPDYRRVRDRLKKIFSQ
jgi:SprT-like family